MPLLFEVVIIIIKYLDYLYTMGHHKIQIIFLVIYEASPINKIQTVIGTSKCQKKFILLDTSSSTRDHPYLWVFFLQFQT